MLKDIVKYLDRRIPYYLQASDLLQDSDDIFVCREDGVSIFKEVGSEQKIEALGALVAGMWQAAQEVQGNLGVIDDRTFTLQFAAADEGIFVFPLLLDKQRFILVVLFTNKINPGKLKNNCRLLRDSLENDFFEYSETVNSVLQSDKEDFLFNNISDQEIDNLFAFAGI